MDAEEIQKMLDEGVAMTKIATDKGIHHQTLKRFIDRNKLDDYKAFDESPWQIIPLSDVKQCVYINESFKAVFDEKQLDRISSTCGHPKTSLKTSVKPYVNCMELDALDEFVRSLEFDELNNANITKHRHIVHYIYKHCGSLENFREMFGIDFNIVAYSSQKERSFFTSAGHRFEKLVEDVLREIHGNNVNVSVYENGCMPDFVIGDRWLDAKLSKSTVLSPSCETIEKYSKYVDKLSIIYCLDDISDEELTSYAGVDFVHITELYPYISDELLNEISELKEEVRRRKAKGCD